MRKLFLILFLFQFTVVISLPSPSLAQEWTIRKPKGTIKAVNLWEPYTSAVRNYAEGLVTTDKDNNLVPCLAEDWRWTSDKTIEFRLRKGVTFHNGEKFDAEAVRVNWEAYKALESPRVISITNIPDETKFEIIDEHTVRFTLPEPDGLSLIKFRWFFQMAPEFFEKHKVAEKNWVYLPEPGPWGTGPFKLVEGGVLFGKLTERIVLEAYEGYWDADYPKVEKVIFDNSLIGNRKEAMRLCRETEGIVDIVTHIRPLDTLKVAESPFAKVVKDKDAWLRGYINQRKTGSKLRDIRVRRALDYSINREELLKYGARGNAYNLGGGIPEGVFGHNPNIEKFTYDTEKARSLLSESGYPNGFAIKVITHEALGIEAQIIKRMLERVGLKVTLEVFTVADFTRRIYIPLLETPPAEQDWDIALQIVPDFYAHSALTYLMLALIEDSNFRWIEYDPVFEKMWKDMSITLDLTAQEQMIQEMMKYVYDRALLLFIYSPLCLYAVNKEVNFVPQKFGYLRLKETSVTDNHWSIRDQSEASQTE